MNKNLTFVMITTKIFMKLQNKGQAKLILRIETFF